VKIRLNNERLLLLGIFSVAFFLGVGNIFYDWPLSNTIGDEYEGLRVALGILNSSKLLQGSYYPPLWAWLQLPAVAASIAFLLISGAYPDLSSLRTAVILNPGLLLAVPRLLSAILSAAGVFVIYRIGRLVDSKRTGLLASWVYALSFIRLQLAHSGRVNSALLFFSLVGLYFSLACIRNFKTKYWYFTLLFIILASLTYQIGVVLFVLPFLVLVQSGRWREILQSRRMVMISAAIILPLGFLFMEPSILMTHVTNTSFVTSNLNLAQRMVIHLSAILSHETFFAAIAILGLSALFKLKKKYFFPIFSYGFFPFLLYSAVMSFPKARYSFLFIPVVALGAGYWISTKKKTGMLVLILASIFSLTLGLRFNWLTFKKSTYLEARDWVQENVPPQANLLVSIDSIGIIPSASASAVVAAYDTGYHHTQRKLLLERDNTDSVVKNVFFYADLTNLLPADEFKKTMKNITFDYVVSFGCGANEDVRMWSQLERNDYDLRTKFLPVAGSAEIPDVLGISIPFVDLFGVERYGPCINVYEYKNRK
jgi:hypothetical protein